MELIQLLWAQTAFKAFVIMAVAVLIESIWRWPDKYHPLMVIRLLALRMSDKVNRSDTQAQQQKKIAGVLGFVVLILPILLGLSLFIELVHYRAVFELLLLLVALSYSPIIAVNVTTYRRLKLQQKALAKEAVSQIVLRETNTLSPMGCAKAAMESMVLRFHYQFASILFFFYFFGPVTALAVRFIFEFSQQWNTKKQTMRYFGQPIARISYWLQWFPCTLHLFWLALLIRPWKAMPAVFTMLAEPLRQRLSASAAAAINCELGGPAIYYGRKHRYPRFQRSSEVKLAHMPNSRFYITSAKIALLAFYMMISAIIFGYAQTIT